MKSYQYIIASLLCLLPHPVFSKTLPLQTIEVNLQEPVFCEGTLTTVKGGIITAQGLRVQAREIAYTNKTVEEKKVSYICAEGDLLFEYEGHFFVGSKLEFDLINRTGKLYHGRTSEGIWFVGGDLIELKEDGSFFIKNAFITTSENEESSWAVKATSINLTKDKQLSASNIRLNFFHIPCLWLPSFKTNLGFVEDPPIRYKVVWDKGLGPRLTMRYRAFSNEEFNLFLRLDYRLTLGLGAAVESEYFSKDERTTFVTRSYGARDKVVFDENNLQRYRLQGLFTHESLDKKTYTHLTYDKFSDLKMISDFRSTDFEIDTQNRSRLLITHQEDITFANLSLQPRLNPFESINQQLPLIKMGIRPFTLGPTGIYSENGVSVGYLDYVYAHDLIHAHPTLHEVHAARLQTNNRLYRPFTTGPLHITPSVGVIGFFYNNNQENRSIAQGVLTYGGDLKAPFYKNYPYYRHTLEPYLNYTGLSKPKSGPSNHYTFTIDDGLYEINSLRVGVKNNLLFHNNSLFSPNLLVDLYTYGFFYDKTYNKIFPKTYLLLNWSRPSYMVEGHTCWNFEENVLDFCNILTEITVNEHAAFALEFRHRSRFDFRKADHENFLVDMARSIDELVNSPLSDGRNTFLGRLQIRLSPKWSFLFGSHFGWGRASEPSYSSFKMDALTLLTAKWQLKFSYLHTTNDDRFDMQMQFTN